MAELKKFEFSSEDACCKLQWLNKPKKINFTGSKLIITPDVNTDFWQKTYYNPELIADNGHFLYQEVQDKTMVETRFNIESGAKFDQAGLMVRKDNKCWIKAGIEFVDGANTLGCVVTNVYSDWSTQPINLQKLSIRVYRQGASFVGCQALSRLNPLSTSTSTYYSHHDSVDDFYQCLVQVVTSDMLKEISQAPFQMYSLEADEATDSSNCSVVIVNMRYVGSYGQVKSRFLGVRELQETTANAITKAITDIIETHELTNMRLTGLTTDGASVMTGVKKGVATQFKEKYPLLITTHCMAHRLQLVSEKAANKCPYLVKYIAVLNTFAKSLKYSPKLCRILESSKSATGEKARKIKQVFFTRWLSFGDSVQALSGCLSSVISALYEAGGERNAESGAVLKGCAKQMATYKFVYLTAFLADAVGILSILSKTMQKESIQHSTLMSKVKSSVAALESLLKEDGPYVSELKKELPPHDPDVDYFPFKGHDIKDNAKEQKTATETAAKFIDELVTHFAVAFPENGILDALQIFDPLVFDTEQEIASYGNEKFKKLLNHFQMNDDELAAFAEWNVIKRLLKEAASGEPKINANMFYQRMIYPDLVAYPNIGKLATIAVIFPATSVNCERAISSYNAIKTSGRSSLKVTSVEDLMILNIEAPSVQCFPYERAFEIWATRKHRVGFKKMQQEIIEEKKTETEMEQNVCLPDINEKLSDKTVVGLQRVCEHDMQDQAMDLSLYKNIE